MFAANISIEQILFVDSYLQSHLQDSLLFAIPYLYIY
jgi:hypothetical protein